MSRVLYSKYSNERAACFQIRTDIVEENGKKFARKRACSPASKKHVEGLIHKHDLLNELYSNSRLAANAASLRDDGVYFEYLEGDTLEKLLDEYLKAEDYTTLIDTIRDFFNILKGCSELKGFHMTDSFREVFGDVSLPSNLLAADLNNIDYIFGNVFLSDDKLTVIDYEWTFEFPIPFEYLVYRAVHYYTYDHSRKKLRDMGLLRILGITEELEHIFELMEHRFQLYILGELTPVINMYNEIAGMSYTFEKLLEDGKKMSVNKQVIVYYDHGNGYKEEDKLVLRDAHIEDGYFEFKISPKKAKALRIDPVECTCVVNDLKVLCEGRNVYIPNIVTNGFKVGDSYLFATKDPQIIINDLSHDVSNISVCYRINVVNKEVAADICEKIGEFNEFEKKVGGIEEVRRLYNNVVQEQSYKTLYESVLAQKLAVEAQLRAIQHDYVDSMSSISMRITKPMRAVGRATKKAIKSNKITHKMARGLKSVKQNGVKYTYVRTMKKIDANIKRKRFGGFDVDEEQLNAQRKTQFENNILFSIIVPLYNTPEKYLKEMIESVQAQTYGNWELCMADGSDKEHKNVEKICSLYARKDKRIKYKKLDKNEGISENTNQCISMASGEYIALFDHDDLLHPSALYENMCVIDKENADFIYSDENTFSKSPADAYCPHYKPDFSPDTLRSYNYICHFSVFKRSLLEEVGNFRKEFDGSQDYDMILRLTEKANKIVHIPKIIYYWRAHPQSVASNISAKTYCLDAAKNALTEHLDRVGLKGQVMDASIPSVYKINYEIKNNPKISILIPNKDYIEDLSKCVNSILNKSTYTNYEIIIIENNSELESTFVYYKAIENDEKVKVVYWDRDFNYSAINNFGAGFASGEYILLLNNDVEVINPDWLQQMLMFAQRKDVGAVGAKLYYPDDTIQHAGIIMGIGGVAGHSHKGFPRDAYGYSSRLQLAQNLSAVTAACMLIRREVFDEVNGLDEGFKVAFNDVDLCMKVRAAGYLIVFTPYAELYHYESKSRGYENTPEKVARFNNEIQRFYSKWSRELEEGDPYYNPNLSLRTEDFAIKSPDEGKIRA